MSGLRLLPIAALGAFLGFISGSQAQAPSLDVPLDCDLGQNCWVASYYDDGQFSNVHDYLCGGFTYPGNDGTDFAVRDLKAAVEGVTVTAAAPGEILRLRNDMPDETIGAAGREAIAGRECGNGVLIDHGGGWQTQYCHLRLGSLAVREGDRVSRGQRLGMVGLSGYTSFPHLHFKLTYNGREIDPFLGLDTPVRNPLAVPPKSCTAGGAKSLWSPVARRSIAYTPGIAFNLGIVAGPADWGSARRGDYRDARVSNDAEAMTLWAEILGTAPRSEVILRIRGPNGAILVEQVEILDRLSPVLFRTLSLQKSGEPWRRGTYRGEILVNRKQPTPGLVSRDVAVEIK